MGKGVLTTNMGEISISNDVIAFYAGLQALECFGIVGMAAVNVGDGLVKLLKGDNVSKGVWVNVKDNRLSIDYHVIVAYGVSIMAVSENLRENVEYKLEKFTGMSVDKINIYVEGVRVID